MCKLNDIPLNAFALRPVRFFGRDEVRYYEAATFPRDPRAGCLMYLRRCSIAGGIPDDDSPDGVCDVLDNKGDVIWDVSLNRAGLSYLKKKLSLRVDD